MNVARLMTEACLSAPDSIAVAVGAQPLHRYRDLAERVARLAGFLASQKVGVGDRVGIAMTNHPAYVEVLYAIFHAGAVAVPVNAKLHERELAFILDEAAVDLCIVNGDTESVAGRAIERTARRVRLVSVDSVEYGDACRAEAMGLVPRDGDDLAWLFFTSGTTGRPKGAMLTHRNLLLMTASYLMEVDEVGAGDAILHGAPMSHGSGMYNFAHVARTAAQVFPESRGFDVAEIAHITQLRSGISMFAAPTMVRRLLSHPSEGPEAFPGLKLIVYGGGPMLVEQILNALTRLGPRFVQIYGQGECPMTISRLPRALHERNTDDASYRRRLGSVGVPFNLVDVRIGDPETPFETEQAGEILVRSPLVMKGYWRQESSVMQTETFDRDWLRTGDVGYFDAEGFLHLSDRSKDVIISGGTNIYSREIEDVLIEHPGVLEVAVIGRPNEEWGEEVVAVVAHGAMQPPSVLELETLCAARIARFKRPRRYVFIRELPKNAYGKIEKNILKEQVRLDA